MNRREFIKTGIAAGAVLALPISTCSPKPRPCSKKRFHRAAR